MLKSILKAVKEAFEWWGDFGASKLPPYRRVVFRSDDLDGERVTLECGHRLIIQRHRRESFPCEECQEARQC